MQILAEGRRKNIVLGRLPLPSERHPVGRYGTYSEMWQSPDHPGLDELLRVEVSGTVRFCDGCLEDGPGSTRECVLAENLSQIYFILFCPGIFHKQSSVKTIFGNITPNLIFQ